MRHRRAHRWSRRQRDVWGIAGVPLLLPTRAAALDADARERGIAEVVLMESAGRAAASVLDRLHPRGRVAVVAGSGNNGGDALVLARTLLAWGRDVDVVAVGSSPPADSLRHGFDVPAQSADRLEALAARAEVLVDGVLGTGASGAPRGSAAAAIEGMNAAGRPIVALDLPSGVDAMTGRVPAQAVRAALTICFGWPKFGLLFQPARDHCGRLVVVEIGFPPYAAQSEEAQLITPAWARERLPVRPPAAHKGTSGRLLILAGQSGMAGAATLAARAAARAGAGLVRVASDAGNRLVLQVSVPEATFTERGSLDAGDAATMRALLAGPGIGTDADARSALQDVLAKTGSVPVALDADALNQLAAEPDRLRAIAAERDTVITPHPMELSRLTGRALDEITADPAGAARAAARDYGCTVLLKGQPSVIASPDAPLLVNTVGSSDLASAGMGDQLSGTIGAMLAAGLAAREAAAVALFYSGRAADLAGLGRALAPEDVTAHLPDAFASPGAQRSPTGIPFVTFDQPPRW